MKETGNPMVAPVRGRMSDAVRWAERTMGVKLRCYRYRGVHIPVCWSATIHGPERCTCKTNAELEREFKAWQREPLR